MFLKETLHCKSNLSNQYRLVILFIRHSKILPFPFRTPKVVPTDKGCSLSVRPSAIYCDYFRHKFWKNYFHLLKAFTSDMRHLKSFIAYILLILMPKTTYIIAKASKIGPNKWKMIKNGLKFCPTKKVASVFQSSMKYSCWYSGPLNYLGIYMCVTSTTHIPI